MEEIKLEVQLRKEVGCKKIKSLRRNGFFPAVVYGGERGPTTIKVDQRAYEHIMRQHKGQSVVFHLNVKEGDKFLRDYSAVVKEEQLGPVSDRLVHVDFKRISLNVEIEVKVQVVSTGEAPGVKNEGGSLDQALWELDVVCLPANIPEKIEVDVSELNIGDAIHVKDIQLPQGVITKHDPEGIFFSVVPPMKEEEPVSEEEDLTEPELTGEKKEGEEGEAKEESAAEAKPEGEKKKEKQSE